MVSMQDIARSYIVARWSPVPIPYKAKRPTIENWQNLRITAETVPAYFNCEAQNIGVLLGSASRGLTDVDLDCDEAIAAAPFLLPKTHIFGRKSKRGSHWLYYSDLAQTKHKATIQFKDGAKMLLEVRIGGGSSGAQTVFPPSTHPSDEAIRWEDQDEVATIGGADLIHRAKQIAAAALLARCYPQQGGRHDAALTFGGFLARCGFSVEEARLFAMAVCAASNQPSDKRKDIIRAVEDSIEAFAAGKETAGKPKMIETFGEKVTKKCAEWLDYHADARPPGEAGAAARPPAADLDGERWTELGNAHRLIARHGENIRYVHLCAAWFTWDGHYWQRDDDGQIMRLAEDTVEAMFNEAKTIADETLRQAFRKFALKTQTHGQFEAMLKLAQHQPGVILSPDKLDADPMLLGVLNGTIELATGTFRDGRREDYISKRCAVAFDPAPFAIFSWNATQFGHCAAATPEIVALKGKRALFINETNESDHLNESRVKYLAGDDTLSGRDLYEKTINFRPTHKALLRTNHKPKIRGTDLGIWRRIHYVPYLLTIDEGEQVEHFRQKVLAPEMPGILNWMLGGLAEYQRGGLRPPPIVSKATEKYRREMDSVGQWISMVCERSTIGAKLYLSEIHAVYAKWATEEIGWVASKQKLAEELRNHGFVDDKPGNRTRFLNIRLKAPKETDDAREDGFGDFDDVPF